MAVDRGLANVTNDMQYEQGHHSVEGIVPIGATVHITTVQFAYRGKLVAVTPSWYVLEDVVNVFNTGDLRNYYKTKQGSEEEPWGYRIPVERTAVTAMWMWAPEDSKGPGRPKKDAKP